MSKTKKEFKALLEDIKKYGFNLNCDCDSCMRIKVRIEDKLRELSK